MDQEGDRRQRIAKILETAKLYAAFQVKCEHLKENGRSRVWAWITSDGVKHYICNMCREEFSEDTLKPHLVPEALFEVGGPSSMENCPVDLIELYNQHMDYATGFAEEAIIYGTMYREAMRQSNFYREQAERLSQLSKKRRENE